MISFYDEFWWYIDLMAENQWLFHERKEHHHAPSAAPPANPPSMPTAPPPANPPSAPSFDRVRGHASREGDGPYYEMFGSKREYPSWLGLLAPSAVANLLSFQVEKNNRSVISRPLWLMAQSALVWTQAVEILDIYLEVGLSPFLRLLVTNRICSFLRLEIRIFLYINLHLPLLLGNLSMHIWIQNSDIPPGSLT